MVTSYSSFPPVATNYGTPQPITAEQFAQLTQLLGGQNNTVLGGLPTPVSNIVNLNQSGIGNNNNVGSIFQGAFAPAPVNNGYSLPASSGLDVLQQQLGAGLSQNYALQGQASGLDSGITGLIAQLQGGNYGATNCFPTAQPTNYGATNCFPSTPQTGYPMMDPSTFFQGGLAGLFGQGGSYGTSMPSYGGGGQCHPHHKHHRRHHGGGFAKGNEFHASWVSVNGSSWFAKLPSQSYQSGYGSPVMPQYQNASMPYAMANPMLYTAQV